MKLSFKRKQKKEYVLMHKDVPVLKGDYDQEAFGFSAVTEVIRKDHLPYSSLKDGELSLKRLNRWFQWRGIPDYRVGLNSLLDRLGIEEQRELLNKEYALSLSDHYWIKEEGSNASYKKLNFFEREYDDEGFGLAVFARSRYEAEDSVFHTPNNALCGYHRKVWMIRDQERNLYKGGSPLYQLEPINEKLASEIGRRLGMDCVMYDTEVYENYVVSVCRNMLSLETELITGHDVLATMQLDKDKFWLNDYITALTNHGVPDVSKKMDDLILLDFLMMNTDRHNQNLGVLINPDTMDWISCAPIFDTGTGLGCLKDTSDLREVEHIHTYRLFNAEKIFDNISLYLILNIGSYDFSALDGIDEFYQRELLRYKHITELTDERIDISVSLLKKRIKMIKAYQMKSGGRR